MGIHVALKPTPLATRHRTSTVVCKGCSLGAAADSGARRSALESGKYAVYRTLRMICRIMIKVNTVRTTLESTVQAPSSVLYM
jgi:hypothetical protein